MQDFKSEKLIWTVDDFENMGWLECSIYAIGFPPDDNVHELWFDIDYIFEWVKPEVVGGNFKFWTAPATLVFENVHKVDIDFDDFNGMRIFEIVRENPVSPPNGEAIGAKVEWTWTIGCHRGEITLQSIGLKQYIRAAPKLSNSLWLGRGADIKHSFAKVVGDA